MCKQIDFENEYKDKIGQNVIIKPSEANGFDEEFKAKIVHMTIDESDMFLTVIDENGKDWDIDVEDLEFEEKTCL